METVVKAVGQSLERLRTQEGARHAAETSQMRVSDVVASARSLRDAAMAIWPNADLPTLTREDGCEL